jgi:glyoxylate utilization-related uncharacterized protein
MVLVFCSYQGLPRVLETLYTNRTFFRSRTLGLEEHLLQNSGMIHLKKGYHVLSHPTGIIKNKVVTWPTVPVRVP